MPDARRFEIRSWQLVEPGQPLRLAERTVFAEKLKPDRVLIRVAGCGVCHTDVGFAYEGVHTRHALPLTLGHEISGTVVAAARGLEAWIGLDVVVPAVMPCGRCNECRRARSGICPEQLFFGSDVDGGFASFVEAPAHGLCRVDRARLEASGLQLADLSVVADAVSTAYQAVLRSETGGRDVAIFVGAGGVGGFALQIASALGAETIAIDTDPSRLEALSHTGAGLGIDPRGLEPKVIRARIQSWAEGRDLPKTGWKIFETSGRPAGQELAFSLLGPAATLMVVGYTLEKISVRLSNLMAFDATARGNWGCSIENYPGALSMVLDGKISIAPFIEHRPMHRVNSTLLEMKAGTLKRRPVLIPDFES